MPIAYGLVFLLIGIVVGTAVPQLGISDARNVAPSAPIVVGATILGVLAGAYLSRFIHEAPELARMRAGTPPPPAFPRGPATAPVSVTAGSLMIIFLTMWLITSAALCFLNLLLGLVFLMCTPLLAMGITTGLRITDDEIIIHSGCGPARLHFSVPIRIVTSAQPTSYNWADGGGIGIRSSGDGVIYVAARSGDAVRINTVLTNYVVVVPDGTATDIAGDINRRCDLRIANNGNASHLQH
ncbi:MULTISPECIES: hypothetical protein [unclassified Corynebacterium]|uniref:hypothetical protein n=1 Tax=unclassified Corynebacterium TaxID=2624378 RepID=UPI0030B53267